MLQDYFAFLQANAAWFVALVLATLMGAQLERIISRRGGRRRRGGRFDRTASPRPTAPTPSTFDSAAQLRIVEHARFEAQRVLNRGEMRLLNVLERACANVTPGWRVLAQVSLGEILRSADSEAYRAINSKRVDLLIMTSDGHPLHAIEFQGTGHHLGPAATRDAIKKEALRKAGIGFIEVMPGDTADDVHAMVTKLVARQSAAA